jgi:hypothetical protein
METTCTVCGCAQPIEAGFADADGKRFAALFADMEPALGRAVIGYLRLFKPAKTQLRMVRAIRLVQELLDLVNAGTVARDERTGVRRPASPAIWTLAIEQMLQSRAKLTLPLDSHNYLRAIAFGLADSADAVVERKKEADVRAGKHPTVVSEKSDKLAETLAWLRSQLSYGAITQEQHDAQARAAREKFA